MNQRIVLAAAAVLTLFGTTMPLYYVNVMNYVGLYALVALGVVMLTGVAGITSFGQAAFVGLGAYSTAFVTLHFGASPWLGLLFAVGLAVLSALCIGLLTLRLSGHYLPLSTIAWGLSAYYLFGSIEALGGHTGLSDIPPISVGPFALSSQTAMFALIWATVLLAMKLSSNLLDSRVGRAMRSIKNARQTAESFGIDTARLRLVIFIYASILAAFSGWIYAHMLRFVNPSPFDLNAGIKYLFMVVVGGAGQLWGAVAGAGGLTLLQESLQGYLPGFIGQAGQFETIAYGVLIIGLLQVSGERGVSGWLSRYLRIWSPPTPKASDNVLLSRRQGNDPVDGPLFEVRGVCKSFGGLRALNDVSFSVGAREIVAVIGPNGAGKSTLFNCITGVIQPDAGELSLRGERFPTGHVRQFVREGVARTFQHVQLVPGMSVIENTMIGAHVRGNSGPFAAALHLERSQEQQLRAEAIEQLRRVGLGEVAYADALSLSLGQQRLVEIARALCADPNLLLLDEPAAGLRRLEKHKLATLLHELRAQGLSILLIEHDMEFIMQMANRIVVMNYGEKLVEGPPQAVQNDPRVVEAYLGSSAA